MSCELQVPEDQPSSSPQPKKRLKGTKRSRKQAGLALDSDVKNSVKDYGDDEAMELMSVATKVALTCTTAKLTESYGLSARLFFTPDPEELAEVEENTLPTSACDHELREVSTSLIKSSPFPGSCPPEVVHYQPSSSEADYSRRVRAAMGFEFPHVMSQYIEELVQDCWDKLKTEGKINADSENAESKFHLTVFDAHIALVDILKAYFKREHKDKQSVTKAAREAVREALGEGKQLGQQDSDSLSSSEESWSSDKSE